MTVYRKVQRYADPQTSKTPAQKEPDPDLGYDFIPKERYTSKEFMELEWERLWTKDENGQYNAFYNVCSHRGNQVAYGQRGHVSSFRCSFHLWEYNLRGELINVPDAETLSQGAPCDKLSIVKLRCEAWGGWVWFSMNPDAEPLQDYLDMIPAHLDPYHFEHMTLVNDTTVEWDVNWKTSVDAFNETHHVNGTHPQLMTYIEDMDVQIDCYKRHSRYLIPFGVVSTHWKDGTGIAEPMKDYMRMMYLDPDTYEGDGLGVRRAVQENLRKNDKALGFDFSELNDDQLSDDYLYRQSLKWLN